LCRRGLSASNSSWRPGGSAAITTPEGERLCMSLDLCERLQILCFFINSATLCRVNTDYSD